MSDFVKQEEGIVPQQNISNNLSVLVDIGMRTEQEQSAALRAIQLGVASSACTNIATMHSVSVLWLWPIVCTRSIWLSWRRSCLL